MISRCSPLLVKTCSIPFLTILTALTPFVKLILEYSLIRRRRTIPRGLSPKTVKMLDTAYTFIQSVDYSVSLRWLFYRCMSPLGLTKKDYSRFVRVTAKARKEGLRGWHPSIISDETRGIYNPNTGLKSVYEWVHQVKNGVECNLDKHIGQYHNIVVCFEASAMLEQFKKYTGPYFVPLVPFRGDASIPLKKEVADLITLLADNTKPVTVLYFGDLDPKGKQIPQSAFSDIRKWTSVDFNFVRVGLNKDHIERYQIAENPVKPGEFQWEALDDTAAAELITDSLENYIDLGKIKKISALEVRSEAFLRKYLKDWSPEELLPQSDSVNDERIRG